MKMLSSYLKAQIIESGAFKERKDLKDVVIPDSVREIGEHAFESCSGLKSVVIPNSETYIAPEAFDEDCTIIFS